MHDFGDHLDHEQIDRDLADDAARADRLAQEILADIGSDAQEAALMEQAHQRLRGPECVVLECERMSLADAVAIEFGRRILERMRSEWGVGGA